MKAIASAKSGAVPTVTDVREAPTSSIERREQDLREPGREQPGEEELPGVRVVVPDERRGERDDEARP